MYHQSWFPYPPTSERNCVITNHFNLVGENSCWQININSKGSQLTPCNVWIQISNQNIYEWFSIRSPRNRWRVVCHLILEAKASRLSAWIPALWTQHWPQCLHGLWKMNDRTLPLTYLRFSKFSGSVFLGVHTERYLCSMISRTTSNLPYLLPKYHTQ